MYQTCVGNEEGKEKMFQGEGPEALVGGHTPLTSTGANKQINHERDVKNLIEV